MRFKPIIMIALAVVFGGSAILVGNSWLAKQAAQHRPAASPAEQAAPMATIVVASSALRYGDEVTGMKLKQIPWPAAALPAGAFSTVDDVAKGGKADRSFADGAERARAAGQDHRRGRTRDSLDAASTRIWGPSRSRSTK